MTNEQKIIKAKALLSAIVKGERKLQVLKSRAEARRAKLEDLMKSLATERVSRAGWEALRYDSTTYAIDDEQLLAAIQDDVAVMDKLMPRSSDGKEVRAVIDGKLFEDRKGLRGKVRECCTQGKKWSLKIQAEKQKLSIGKKKAKAA